MDTLDILKKATCAMRRADHIFNRRSDAAGQLRRSSTRRTRRLNRVGATLAVVPSCRHYKYGKTKRGGRRGRGGRKHFAPTVHHIPCRGEMLSPSPSCRIYNAAAQRISIYNANKYNDPPQIYRIANAAGRGEDYATQHIYNV